MSDVRDQRPEAVPFLADATVTNGEPNSKNWSQKSWKEKRKTKFCGIRFDWLLFIAAALFVIIVIAASISHTVGNNGPNPPPPAASSSITASAQ